MALFLTGMINDAARTAANGPSETRVYQTAAEGAVGGEAEVRGCQPGPSPPLHPPVPPSKGSHCAVPLSKAAA